MEQDRLWEGGMERITFTMGDENTDALLGDTNGILLFTVSMRKTWRNRIKLWLFFQFFPFKFKGWQL